MDIKILHKDPLFVVVEKPGGMLSVPGRGPEKQDCVTARVKALFPGCIEQPAVRRLDMGTSGLMVLGLTKESHRDLCRQFADRQVAKRYVALLEGDVSGDSGEIHLSFRLDLENRPLQVYDPDLGKPGHTLWRKIAVEAGRTRVEFTPLTGRTHQLRLHAVHEKGLCCPVVGDIWYGSGNEGDPLLLHAAYLAFSHPETGKQLEFTSLPGF